MKRVVRSRAAHRPQIGSLAKSLFNERRQNGAAAATPQLDSCPELRRVLLAQESERRRIARELHDEFGQRLTGLKFDLAWLRKHLPLRSYSDTTDSLIIKTDSIVASVEALMISLRQATTALHPSILDDLGFVPALQSLVNDFHSRTTIECELNVDPALTELVMTVEASAAVYRIVQELLTNVVRHARASTVRISLFERAGRLLFELIDNGKGIEQHQLRQRGSLGIRGIQERVDLLNGRMTITGHDGLGTTVSIAFPFTAIFEDSGEEKNDS